MSFEHHTLPNGECAVCGSSQQLLLCSACRVIHYCGRDHQTSDRGAHKAACTAVKKSAAILSAEDEKIRSPTRGGLWPGNLFNTHPGHFWGVTDTRDYMRARFAHVEALLQIKTFEAVDAVYKHVMDLHRLCRSDNMGVRDLTPHCMIRLGRDQECYDFLKWWATVGQDSDYDWGDMNAPFLNTNDADMFEPVDVFIAEESFTSLSHLVALTLLKVRLLAKLKISGQADIDAQVSLLDAQIDQLFRKVQKANKPMWSAILVPQHDLGKRPAHYSVGDRGEMQIVLNYTYDAWKETPDAIAVVFYKIAAFAGADTDILRSG